MSLSSLWATRATSNQARRTPLCKVDWSCQYVSSGSSKWNCSMMDQPRRARLIVHWHIRWHVEFYWVTTQAFRNVLMLRERRSLWYGTWPPQANGSLTWKLRSRFPNHIQPRKRNSGTRVPALQYLICFCSSKLAYDKLCSKANHFQAPAKPTSVALLDSSMRPMSQIFSEALRSMHPLCTSRFRGL